MQSMTGYGRGTAQADGREIIVELKSVNHRYLDYGIRLPRSLNFLDDVLRSCISKHIERGHVDVFVSYQNMRSDARRVQIDKDLLQAYLAAAKDIDDLFDLENDLSIVNAMRLPEVLTIAETPDDQEEISLLCEQATVQAVTQLIEMRKSEGERLQSDLTQRTYQIVSIVDKMQEYIPNAVAEYQAQLFERIEQLIGSEIALDQTRLANEVAIYADKSSIDEELVRLNSHLAQLLSLLEQNKAIGRKIDFVIQEINRELNTIGSKSGLLDVLNLVIQAKADCEKVREQIQNIE